MVLGSNEETFLLIGELLKVVTLDIENGMWRISEGSDQ